MSDTAGQDEEQRYTLEEARKLLCEHDYRVDPAGWQTTLFGGISKRRRSEYRSVECAKCGHAKTEYRTVNLVGTWPKVDAE
jgi:hypothetical protein